MNDHLRELWPHTRRSLRQRTLVTQAMEVVASASGRRGQQHVEVCAAALLGTHAQWARLMHFGGLQGPPSRWADELVRTALRICL